MFLAFQINTFVEEVAPTVAFWRALGFEETYRTPQDGPADHVELQAGGLKIGVARASIAREQYDEPIDTKTSHPYEVVLWCDDVDATFDAALAAGGQPQLPPYDYRGRLRSARLFEPGGHPIKLTQRTAQ